MNASDIATIFSNLDKSLGALVPEVANEALTRVKAKTPVDTGRLRDDWSVIYGANDFQIANSQDYATPVEMGTPKQNPAGMVRRTVAEFPAIVAAALPKVGL